MKKLIFAVIAVVGATCMTAQAQTKDTTKKVMKSPMTKVAMADVPAAVTTALKSPDYTGWTVSQVYTNSDKTRYSVHVMKGTEKKTLWFDQNGTAIVKKN